MTKAILINKLKLFLNKHLQGKGPLIFGYSGGPDSKALLYLLLEVKKKCSFDLNLVHLDHSQRKESEIEAKKIQEEAKELNLPCYIDKIDASIEKGAEDFYRNKRYQFYKKIYKKVNAQALILAHHANDLHETVLKRVLEGANLTSIFAMQEVALQEGLTIWRPLLPIEKQTILAYLQEEKRSYFIDYTNDDGSNLRSRFRKSFFSSLEKNLNKKIGSNLLQLSKRSLELKEYLDGKTDLPLSKRVKGCFGTYFDYGSFDMPYLEKKHLLYRLLEEERSVLSRRSIEVILQWIEKNEANKTIKLNRCDIFVDRKKIFLKTKNFPTISKIILKPGIFNFSWGQIKVEERNSFVKKIGWQKIWLGEFSFSILPKEYYLLLPPSTKGYCLNKRLKKIWEQYKVPAFFRYCWPVLYEKDKIVGEILSGQWKLDEGLSRYYYVSFLIKNDIEIPIK